MKLIGFVGRNTAPITLSKSAMTRLRNVICNYKIFKKTRKRLMQHLVFSVRFDAFEMWVWQKMLRIPWTARRNIVNEIQQPVGLSILCERRILGILVI